MHASLLLLAVCCTCRRWNSVTRFWPRPVHAAAIPRSGSRLGNHCYFCLLEFPAMYSPQPTSELESLQHCSTDIDISLAAVGNYELHLGLWLSVYRHSVDSLKSMCLDELAMSGAINYCLCRLHFACGLMSSKQGYH